LRDSNENKRYKLGDLMKKNDLKNTAYLLSGGDIFYLLKTGVLLIDRDKELRTACFKGDDCFKSLCNDDFKELYRIMIKEYLRRLK
jgi:hypothetical protein